MIDIDPSTDNSQVPNLRIDKLDERTAACTQQIAGAPQAGTR